MSREDTIRILLQEWAEITRNNNKGEILKNHAEDVLIYDVLPPFKYEGTEAYKKSWDDWQPEVVVNCSSTYTT